MGRRLWADPARLIICFMSWTSAPPDTQIIEMVGHGRPGPSNFQGMDRGPARLIILFSFFPGPALPCSSCFEFFRPGCGSWHCRFFPARSGPAHKISSEVHEIRALYGPVGHRCRPARGLKGSARGSAYSLPRTNQMHPDILISFRPSIR